MYVDWKRLYYFDLLETHKLDLGDNLYLFNSKLGWILGGHIEGATIEKSPVPSLLVRTVGQHQGKY